MPGLGANVRQSRAVSVGGNLEPIEPVYTKANTQSGLGTPYPIPSASVDPNVGVAGPVVHRAADTRGMRYLYADIRQRQPISPLGTGPDIGNAVWSSEFQPDLGTLRDYGFYDLLYRAGYPGFNLALSFRVAVNPSVGSNAPGSNIKMTAPPMNRVVNVLKRATGRANQTG